MRASSDGSSLPNLSLHPSTLEAIHRDVPRALELLHRVNLVFGDPQELNVLYLPKKGRALLIHFDIGKDRYPACLKQDKWLGVSALQVMEMSHDVENFERLMNRLSGELTSGPAGLAAIIHTGHHTLIIPDLVP